MASLYAARDFRVNVLRRIQFIQLGGFLLAFLLSGLIFPVENIPAGPRPTLRLYADGDNTSAGRRPACSWPACGVNESQTMSPRRAIKRVLAW